MNKIIYNGVLVLAVFTSLFISCQKPESYSVVPEIKLLYIRVHDTTVIEGSSQKNVTIDFSFVDGDGDIGYDTTNTDTLHKDNLFFTTYQKRMGVFVNVDSLNKSPLSYRIPYRDIMARTGQNKTLKGSIKIELEQQLIQYDTIKYDFYITDRSLNKSNVETTGEIILK
jgi:hypothetical protein